MHSMARIFAALVWGTVWPALSPAAASATAGAGQRQVEQALESTSALISAATANGSISVRECAACPRLLLNLTAGSKFFAGGQELSFEAFSKAMSAPQPRSVSVYYRDADKAVTRIVIATP